MEPRHNQQIHSVFQYNEDILAFLKLAALLFMIFLDYILMYNYRDCSNVFLIVNKS